MRVSGWDLGSISWTFATETQHGSACMANRRWVCVKCPGSDVSVWCEREPRCCAEASRLFWQEHQECVTWGKNSILNMRKQLLSFCWRYWTVLPNSLRGLKSECSLLNNEPKQWRKSQPWSGLAPPLVGRRRGRDQLVTLASTRSETAAEGSNGVERKDLLWWSRPAKEVVCWCVCGGG